MKYTVILPAIIAFVISAVLCPIIIPFLQKLKFGQFIRDEGPEAHQKKTGTPTMGGMIFIISVILTSLFYMKDYPMIIPVAFATNFIVDCIIAILAGIVLWLCVLRKKKLTRVHGVVMLICYF